MKSVVIRSFATLGIFVAIALPGCGGGTSSTSGSGSFTTGLERDSVLSGLRAKEIEQMCQMADEFANRSITDENLCRLAASVDAARQTPVLSEEKCEETKAECLNEISQWEDSVETCSSREALSDPSCKATVGVFEQCVEEIAGEFDSLFDRAQCSAPDPSLEGDFEAFIGTDVPQTPGCIELMSQCPGLFEEE